MSTTSKITMFRGEDVTLSFTMSPVVNISGWTITFGARLPSSTTPLFTATGTVVSGAAGTFTVPIASASTDDLDPGFYAWDVRRTDSGGRATLADGTLHLRREVVP